MNNFFLLSLFCVFACCKSQNANEKTNVDSSKNVQPLELQDVAKKIHYFSTTTEEYDYIVDPKGLLNFVKGLSKIKSNYSLESIGIDGYTKDKDIDLSYLMRWEGKNVFPCAFVVAFLEKEKVINLKCIPINDINEDLTAKAKNDFKKIDSKWLPNLIQLLLNFSNQYAIKVNFY